MLAIDGKEVAGQIGLIPVKLKYRENIFDAQWACDLMVLPEKRKRGIAKKLFTEAIKRDVISIGNNPSPAADVVMKKIGFKAIPSGRTMIFPINSEHILKWALKGKYEFAVLSLNKIIQPYFNFKRKKIRDGKTDFKKCRWESVSDLISADERGISAAHILHDKEFLEWRANGYDRFSKRIEAAVNDNESYLLYSPIKPYINIFQWNCKDPEDIKKMTSFILEEAIQSGSEMIQIISNNPGDEEILGAIGYVRARNSEQIIQYSEKRHIDDAEKFYFTLYDTDLHL